MQTIGTALVIGLKLFVFPFLLPLERCNFLWIMSFEVNQTCTYEGDHLRSSLSFCIIVTRITCSVQSHSSYQCLNPKSSKTSTLSLIESSYVKTANEASSRSMNVSLSERPSYPLLHDLVHVFVVSSVTKFQIYWAILLPICYSNVPVETIQRLFSSNSIVAAY